MENSLNSNKSQDFIQSFEKGLNIIKAFSAETPTLTISEAAKMTGYSRPTARRFLLTLESLGYATSNNGVFSLTAHTLTLGYAYLSTQNMWNIAHPFMKDFVNMTGESSSIGVLDGSDVIYVARVPTKRIMTINLSVGSRLPANVTSIGHILLANLPKNELEMYLENVVLEGHTDNSITTKEKLIEELTNVRDRGWANVDQQLEDGLRSIAAPITNREGKVIAALNCSTHAGRINKEKLLNEYLPQLIETAKKISDGIATTSHY